MTGPHYFLEHGLADFERVKHLNPSPPSTEYFLPSKVRHMRSEQQLAKTRAASVTNFLVNNSNDRPWWNPDLQVC